MGASNKTYQTAETYRDTRNHSLNQSKYVISTFLRSCSNFFRIIDSVESDFTNLSGIEKTEINAPINISLLLHSSACCCVSISEIYSFCFAIGNATSRYVQCYVKQTKIYPSVGGSFFVVIVSCCCFC